MEKKVREVKTRGRIEDMTQNELYEPQLINIILQMHRQCLKMLPYSKGGVRGKYNNTYLMRVTKDCSRDNIIDLLNIDNPSTRIISFKNNRVGVFNIIPNSFTLYIRIGNPDPDIREFKMKITIRKWRNGGLTYSYMENDLVTGTRSGKGGNITIDGIIRYLEHPRLYDMSVFVGTIRVRSAPIDNIKVPPRYFMKKEFTFVFVPGHKQPFIMRKDNSGYVIMRLLSMGS